MELHEDFKERYLAAAAEAYGHAELLRSVGVTDPKKLSNMRSEIFRSMKMKRLPTVATLITLEPVFGASKVVQYLVEKEDNEQISERYREMAHDYIEAKSASLNMPDDTERDIKRAKKRKASRAYWLERAQVLDMMAEQAHTRNTRERLTDAQLANFAQKLKTKRKALELSQGALSRQLEISQSVICSWEKAKSHPTRTWVNRVSEALGITVEELLGGET